MFQMPSSELVNQLQANKLFFESAGENGSAVALSLENHQYLELSGSIFVDGVLYETDFSYSNLAKSNFSDALANGAIFENADISECNFTKTQLFESIFRLSKARNTKFKKTELSMANFQLSSIENSVFDESICIKTDFGGSLISDSGFFHVNLHGANFKNAALNRVKFDHFSIDSHTNFENIIGLESCILKNGVFEGVLMSQMELSAYFLENFSIKIQ